MKVNMAGNRDGLVLDPGILPLPTWLGISGILGLCLPSYHLTWCPASGRSLCTNVWSLVKLTELSHGHQKKAHYFPNSAKVLYPSCPASLPSFGKPISHMQGSTLWWVFRLGRNWRLLGKDWFPYSCLLGLWQETGSHWRTSQRNLQSFSTALTCLFYLPLPVALELFGRHLQTGGETAII